MIEFLLILAGIWLVIASYCDIKKREVPNWLNFSLIAFALAYRAFYSAISQDLVFFVYGLAGFMVFFILAYAFYYGRIFAGGDAKLLMGLGAILPFSNNIASNLLVFGLFVFLLLLAGSVYGLLYSFFLVIKNPGKFVKEFNKEFNSGKKLVLIGLIFAILSLIFVFYIREAIFAVLPLIILIFPFLFIYGKAVENSCMIVEMPGNKATVGDWIYEPVKVRGKIIKPYWEGLSEEEVKLLRKVKKIKIKQGIPFVPSFLIAFILLLLFGDYIISLFFSIY
jgi:Flp pilus assembly protein protease CpaA